MCAKQTKSRGNVMRQKCCFRLHHMDIIIDNFFLYLQFPILRV